MKKKSNLLLLFIVLVLAFSAQAKRKKKVSKNNKPQVLSFEDDLIKGDIQKPDLIYLLDRKKYKFKKLIRLRDNFLPEMRRTSEDIPSGSVN